ncbi:HET-domain-containing protein [Nemania serpens]|nr:HET-domain-containing protein [Nemania serpens]
MLCSTCQQVFREPITVNSDKSSLAEYKCETTFSAIYASGGSCFTCHITWQRLRIVDFRNGGQDPTLGLTFTLKTDASSPERNTTLKIVARHEPSKRDFWAQALVEEESQIESRRLYAITSDSTGSDEALRFVKEKLEECESSHETCRRSIASLATWYPTRLIQLTASGPRLIETRDHAPDSPYATLSHRWGGSNIMTCTNDTKESLEAGIGSAFLTQTFRDALHAIEKLGIKYIWIDSLCIIQGSTEDWTREALTMGKVYRHACINLAATRAESGRTGLYAPRNPDVMSSGPFRIDNGVLKGVFVAVEDALGANWGYWDREVQLAPLNSRGWVMQERVLSPRVVHFAAGQVFWDCAGLTASEGVPGGLVAPGKAMWIGYKQSSSLFIPDPDEAVREEIFGEWSFIVNAYTNCQFTFNSDKLIALAGIAEHLHHVLGYEYLAGLWSRQMELQLCWFVARKEPPATRNHIAPSWSWASVDGLAEMLAPHCYHANFPKNLLATVTDTAVTQQMQGERGDGYVGHITVRCFLNRVTLEAEHPDRLDKCTCARLTGAGAEYARRVDVDMAGVIGAEGLFLAPMFEVPKRHIMRRNCQYSEIRALLLRVVDEAAGKFERCGHVMLEASNFPTGTFDKTWLDLITAEGKAELPCVEYDNKTGHLIQII